MKYLAGICAALVTTPAFAQLPNTVPEMDMGAGFASVALLLGIAAIIREKTKR